MASRKSFGASVTPPKAPSFGGGGNALMSMMLAQSMLPEKERVKSAAATEQESQESEYAVPRAEDVAKQIGESVKGGVFYQPGAIIKTGQTTQPINREVTAEESRKQGAADAISRYTNYIRQQMIDDPNFQKNYEDATFRIGSKSDKGEVFGIPTWAGNNQAMKMAYVIESLQQRLNYLLSGAQINENEYKRLSRRMPSWSHVALRGAPQQGEADYEGLKFILDDIEFSLAQEKKRMILGGNYDARFWEGPNPYGDEKAYDMLMNMDQQSPPQKSPSSPTSPIPGMAGQTGQIDPLDEWRQEFLKP